MLTKFISVRMNKLNQRKKMLDYPNEEDKRKEERISRTMTYYKIKPLTWKGRELACFDL